MSTVDRSAWTRISVTVEQALATRVEEVLDTLGALALTRTDAGDTPQFDGPTPDDPQWPHQEVSGLFNADENVEGVIAALQLVVGQGSIETSVIKDEDWELSGRKNFPPLQISPRLWICPPWEPPTAQRPLAIRITPGLAFGTGTHPTTQLCLRALESINPTGAEVLDWGCGSGILAIAALRLGAASAIGVDLDPRALTASVDNAELNGVVDKLTVLAPEALDPQRRYPIVIANILAGTILELSDALDHAVAPGGTLILSGILNAQADRVCAAFAQYNLCVSSQEEWVALVGQRT